MKDTFISIIKERYTKEKIISIIKCLLLFTLFFTISAIPIALFKININNFTTLEEIVYMLVCDIIFLIIIILCYYKTLLKDFKSYFKNFTSNFEQAFKYYLVGFGIMVVSNIIINIIMETGLSTNEDTVRSYVEVSPLLMLIETSLYAPLAEELLFRKSIREVFDNKLIYIFVSGFIFGALHVISTDGIAKVLYLIPYCSLGFTFAYTYTKTNNIFSSISMHFLHNTATMILLLIGASL